MVSDGFQLIHVNRTRHGPAFTFINDNVVRMGNDPDRLRTFKYSLIEAILHSLLDPFPSATFSRISA